MLVRIVFHELFNFIIHIIYIYIYYFCLQNNYLLYIASHSTSNLKCPQCKKQFKGIASFKSHLKIHLTEELITFNICDQIFYNQVIFLFSFY